MALTLNGSANTIGGLAVGGLPNGIVDTDMIAAAAVTDVKRGAHGILQVVSAEHSTANSVASLSYGASGLTVNITPAHTSNKILVITQSPMWISEEPGTDSQGYVQLLRDSTEIANSVYGGHTGDGSRNDTWATVSFLQLDSPSTTSQVTYSISHRTGSTGWSGTHCHASNVATILCMEIKG